MELKMDEIQIFSLTIDLLRLVIPQIQIQMENVIMIVHTQTQHVDQNQIKQNIIVITQHQESKKLIHDCVVLEKLKHDRLFDQILIENIHGNV
jgi:hypothetical protein